MANELQMDKDLPTNTEAERLVLGSIMLDDQRYVRVASIVQKEHFSLEKHRRIWERMKSLYGRGEKIDRVTVADELMKSGELEAVGGLGYLVSLDDGLPHIINLDSYAKIVADKAALRQMIFAAQHMMNRCLAAEEEPDEILAATEEALIKLGQQRPRAGLVSARAVLESHEGGVNVFLDPSKAEKGLPTGFLRFDELTGGLHSGELVILAGRPSSGKTALALNITQHVAMKLGEPVAIFSLEMSRESLIQRMVSATARVDGLKARLGHLNAHERAQQLHALHDVTSAPIFVNDSASIHLVEIHADLRKLRSERGKIGLVVLDYLQLMEDRGRHENRNQEVSALSRGLKILAKDIGAPVLCLSQLSRAPENRAGNHRPQLSDLRESGAIEQDADLVAFVFREEMYKRDREDLRGLAELILAKQRSGPVGTVNLVFLHHFTKFENRAEDYTSKDTAQKYPYPDEEAASAHA